jgi:hypothetical protein
MRPKGRMGMTREPEAEAARLDAGIAANLKGLEYGGSVD